MPYVRQLRTNTRKEVIMLHKNDYSCIVFYKDCKPKKWLFVHSLSKFVVFLNHEHPGWEYINVYDRRTSTYLKRFYPVNTIPYFLTLLVIVIGLHFFLTFKIKSHQSTFTNDFNNTATISTLNGKGGAQCF